MMRLRKISLTVLMKGALQAAAALLVSASAIASPVSIADIPLSLGASVEPNTMFVLDDSGSMRWGFMPDELEEYFNIGASTNCSSYGSYGGMSLCYYNIDNGRRYLASSHLNKIYYNPDVEYLPPPKGQGENYPDVSFHNAPVDGYNPSSPRVNLSNNYRAVMDDYYYKQRWTGWGWQSYGFAVSASGNPDSAFYYEFSGSAGCTASEGDAFKDSCYSRINISEEEQQNFANWFSYYRTRMMAAKAGIGRAFDPQGAGMRVGYGALNESGNSVDNVSTNTIVRGVRKFEGSARNEFFSWLYGAEANGSTPLKRALDDAGQYYSRKDNRGPWSSTPGQSGGEMLECRQSFTILMTDGYYNTGGANEPDTSGATKNVDNTSGPEYTDSEGNKYKYEPGHPFKDNDSGTLADVAMYYWKRDLHDGLDNKVPTSGSNPAFWQHMVTYGVGLGVTGSAGITPESAFAAISTGTEVPWGNVTTNEGKIDDLLHAAVNSRGGFFNAADPDTFATELSGMLSAIISRVEQSSTAAAASSAVFSEGSLSYSAAYRSTDWSGALQAHRILSGGGRGQLMWDAERELESKGFSARKLFTHNGTGGTALNYSSLSDDQKDALDTALDGSVDGLGADRIAWLSGNNAAGTGFRERSYKAEGSAVTRPRMLGDIIGSNPQYAGKVNAGHRRLGGAEGAAYATFRASEEYAERPDVIYVGANDGFLHAFHAKTGEELFAYMPGEFLHPAEGQDYAAVNELMSPDYDHRFYVDGTPTIADAYLNGEWRTVLLGTTGVGGRTVFALDVSDPDSFSASDILWEFTHAELGRGVSDAQIARLDSGKWVAIFGNGYNSASHESALFIVDLESGNLISHVATGEGDVDSPNGLAAPTIMVNSQSGIAMRAYAGDLLGNIWRFNLASGTPSAQLLFEATDEGGEPQPVTAAPRLAYVPGGSASEVVVLFGTGAYFRVGDKADTQVQSLYGIFDNGSAASIDRDDLLVQEITSHGIVDYTVQTGATSEVQKAEVRTVSGNALDVSHKGWVMDLDTFVGERVISPAAFPSGYPVKRVRFSTLIPDSNACGSGQTGCILDIDVKTGGKTASHIFDLNRDGEYDLGDAASSDVVNGVCNVLSGERITVIAENGNDWVLDSEIDEPGDDYDGPIVDPEPDPDVDPDPDPDPDPESNRGGNLGIANEEMDFGRQNWEELR